MGIGSTSRYEALEVVYEAALSKVNMASPTFTADFGPASLRPRAR